MSGRFSNIHFSTTSDDWATPQLFFDKLAAEFGGFDLDSCASRQNAKVSRFFSRAQDGLSRDWGTCKVWCNPPYGRGITGKWVEKAWLASQQGALVVCLIPARTDTAYWHDFVIGTGAEVRFVRGRLKFGNSTNSAPFPSAVIVFRAVKHRGRRRAA